MTEFPAHVPRERAAAFFVCGLVEADVAQIGDEAELDRVGDGRLPAAVVSEKKAAPADRNCFVLKMIPLDEADRFERFHDSASSVSVSSAASPAGSALVAR